MDFSKAGISKLYICGRTPLALNSIQIKFDDDSSTQLVGFTKADDFEVQEFPLQNVSARQKVSFIFLPGCNFDFKWFKFA
jgi:beta-galactosidase